MEEGKHITLCRRRLGGATLTTLDRAILTIKDHLYRIFWVVAVVLLYQTIVVKSTVETVDFSNFRF